MKAFVFICLSLIIATIAVASVVLNPPSPPRNLKVEKIALLHVRYHTKPRRMTAGLLYYPMKLNVSITILLGGRAKEYLMDLLMTLLA